MKKLAPRRWGLFALLALMLGTVATANAGSPTEASPGTWQPAGSTLTARGAHTASLLRDGRVLIAGGGGDANRVLDSAEIFDPTAGWSAAASMANARFGHTATVLDDGRVLVAGGLGQGTFLSSAELYDPTSGSWSLAGPLSAARARFTATLLRDGRVLAVGGAGVGGAIASAEIYDPRIRAWSAAGAMRDARQFHTATLLGDGRVLVVGGIAPDGQRLATSEIFDAGTGAWSPAASMPGTRGAHTATLLTGGTVLVAGGSDAFGCLATALSYDPAADTWTSVGNMASARATFGSALLEDGRVLAATSCARSGPNAELFDPIARTWSPAGTMTFGTRGLPTVTTLGDGRVLVVGGEDANHAMVGLAEIYSPVQTVTFDELVDPNRPLNGSYGGIDWGTDAWFLSAPWGLFATNSISFSPAPTAESFVFLTPRVLRSVDAYNGGGATTVTFACVGNPTRTQDLSAGQLLTIATGWAMPCTAVTVGSSNGWDTNFDNLTYR
jgi:N-acetylneuraminic acid mutarotase